MAEPAEPQVLNQHSALSNPMGEAFDYAKEFRSWTEALKNDLRMS